MGNDDVLFASLGVRAKIAMLLPAHAAMAIDDIAQPAFNLVTNCPAKAAPGGDFVVDIHG